MPSKKSTETTYLDKWQDTDLHGSMYDPDTFDANCAHFKVRPQDLAHVPDSHFPHSIGRYGLQAFHLFDGSDEARDLIGSLIAGRDDCHKITWKCNVNGSNCRDCKEPHFYYTIPGFECKKARAKGLATVFAKFEFQGDILENTRCISCALNRGECTINDTQQKKDKRENRVLQEVGREKEAPIHLCQYKHMRPLIGDVNIRPAGSAASGIKQNFDKGGPLGSFGEQEQQSSRQVHQKQRQHRRNDVIADEGTRSKLMKDPVQGSHSVRFQQGDGRTTPRSLVEVTKTSRIRSMPAGDTYQPDQSSRQSASRRPYRATVSASRHCSLRSSGAVETNRSRRRPSPQFVLSDTPDHSPPWLEKRRHLKRHRDQSPDITSDLSQDVPLKITRHHVPRHSEQAAVHAQIHPTHHTIVSTPSNVSNPGAKSPILSTSSETSWDDELASQDSENARVAQAAVDSADYCGDSRLYASQDQVNQLTTLLHRQTRTIRALGRGHEYLKAQLRAMQDMVDPLKYDDGYASPLQSP